LSPEHHLTPALSPISWRRGRRKVSGFFEPCLRLPCFLQSTLNLAGKMPAARYLRTLPLSEEMKLGLDGVSPHRFLKTFFENI
jgi:hypothetical protein